MAKYIDLSITYVFISIFCFQYIEDVDIFLKLSNQINSLIFVFKINKMMYNTQSLPINLENCNFYSYVGRWHTHSICTKALLKQHIRPKTVAGERKDPSEIKR